MIFNMFENKVYCAYTNCLKSYPVTGQNPLHVHYLAAFLNQASEKSSPRLHNSAIFVLFEILRRLFALQ